MDMFKRKKVGRKPASEAEHSALATRTSFRRSMQSLLSRKEKQPESKPELSTSTPVSTIRRTGELSSEHDTASPLLDSEPGPSGRSAASQTLWDQAYDKVKTKSPKLVEAYEGLLSRELLHDNETLLQAMPEDDVNVIHQADGAPRRAQLDAIIKQGLQRLDDKKTRFTIAGHEFVPREQIAQAVDLVQWGKSLIGEAVKASPEASIAWAGVSIVLPLLTNPKTAEDANRDGFAYVTT